MYLQTAFIVRREIRRVEEATGVRIDDFLYEVAENAETDWGTDLESIEDAIVNEADNYIDFHDNNC